MKTRYVVIIGLLSLLTVSLWAQKETPPAGGTPKDFNLPQKQMVTLPNGFSGTMVAYGKVPKVNIRVVIRTGNIDESPSQVWLADLAGEFLKEGTKTRTAQDLAKAAASMGGSIDVATGSDQVFITGEVLSEFGPDFIKLIGDMIQNPAFPASELERLKNNMVRQLTVQRSEPAGLASEKFSQVMFGDHPYGRYFPTEETINSFTLDHVKEFYDKNYGARRTSIYVVGVFDAKAIENTLTETFGKWKEGTAATQNPPKMSSSRTIYLIDRPGASQSTIYMGLPVIDPSHADYLGLTVMNSMLGGSFGSRITSNIRENKGYTYSPRSTVSIRYRSAYWAEIADVTTDVTGASIKEILFEVNRLQNEVPEKEELDGIKNYLAGTFVLQNSSPAGIANQLSFLSLHGLPDTYLTNYVKNVYAITPEEISKMVKSYIRDSDVAIVIVGDIKKIKKQVETYGKVIQ
ncbi:insulinase family protein [bacterium]|nr:MAG: insulinase family protein [bacterium]